MAEETKTTQDKTQGKKSGPTPKGSKRKTYPSLSKQKIEEIIDKKMEGKFNVSNSKMYNQGVATENKINKLLGKRYLPVTEDTPTPKNYFYPKSVEDKVKAVMYDKGYILQEDEQQ